MYWRPADHFETHRQSARASFDLKVLFMKVRLSTTMTLALLIGLLVLAGQWVAQVITSDVLVETARAREIDKINTVANLLEGLIAQRGNDAHLLADMLATDQAVAGALQLKASERSAQLGRKLDDIFRQGRVQTLEVTDQDETVIYRAQSPEQVGEKASGWGVSEALTGTGMLVSARDSQGVVIRAIEPLRMHGNVVGTISVGMAFDAQFMSKLSQQVGAKLVLLGSSGVIGTDRSGLSNHLDPAAMIEAFQKKLPIYRVDAPSHKTSVYLPLLIVDEGYVILAELDSTTAFGLIEAGRRRSVYYAILISVVSMLTGLLALHSVLSPLRSLRKRAEKMALELTGESIKETGHDEVTAVVKALDTLTGRLVQRNKDLDRAKAQAEAASAAKSQFLASMSHEIRTPLNGVLGMAELLQSTSLNSEQSRFVGAITSAGRALHGLLCNILDLAKIEEGQVQLEQVDFDPRQIIDDVTAIYREISSTRSLTMVIDITGLTTHWVSGDPTRFRQVLFNLLSNAIKFTVHGEVRLRGETIAMPAGDSRIWCRFSVEDSGVGIAPEALDQLFQRFAQADVSITRQFGGSGLGLTICRHLVELMGGRIQAASTPGLGSRFWFELPFDAAVTPQALLPIAPVPQRSSARILVAEDNAINQLVVRKLLELLGAEVTMVENGKLAVTQVCERHADFDLVLMDCQMPVMDGFEATRQIRAWERTQTLSRAMPIVALTANALAGDREACLAAGMTDFASKPITRAALAEVLARHLPDKISTALADKASHVAGNTPVVFDPSVLNQLPMVADGTNPEFVGQMLDLFVEDTKRMFPAIEQAIREGDLPTLTRYVHTLKSSAAQVGALALSAEARRQEGLLRGGHPALMDWPVLLRQAFDHFELARASQSRNAVPVAHDF